MKRKRNKKRKAKRNINSMKPSKTKVTYAPTGINTTIRNRKPGTGITIKHREFFQDLTSDGTGTQILNFDCNPGLFDMFPWLSKVASAYETYRFNSLTFLFVPVLSSSTDGAVALCPDYDAADVNSSHSKTELLSFEDSVRGNIWSRVDCVCKRSNLHKQKQFFVRATSLAANLDIKTYDTLQLNVLITDSKTTGAALGELWVEYSITFFTPQLNHDNPSGQVFSEAWELTDSTTDDLFDFVNKSITTYGNMIENDLLLTCDNDNITLANNQIAITEPGKYNIVLHSDLSTTGNPGMALSADSDTGDFILSTGYGTTDTTNGKQTWFQHLDIGSLCSRLAPLILTFVAQSVIEGSATFQIDRIIGSVFPTMSKDEIKKIRTKNRNAKLFSRLEKLKPPSKDKKTKLPGKQHESPVKQPTGSPPVPKSGKKHCECGCDDYVRV